MSAIKNFLEQHRIEASQNLIEKLKKLGVRDVTDLKHLRPDDLNDEDLSIIDKRKLMEACESLTQPSPSNASVTMPTSTFPTSNFGPYMPPHHIYPTNIQYYNVPSSHVYPSVRPPPNLQHQYKRYQKRAPSPIPGFKIRYVLCTELFINNQEELFLCLQPEGDTMEHLINVICQTHDIPESLTVELFSEEGSPLNVNCFTMKMTLAQWNIENDDGFYAFIRRKEQPFWKVDEINDSDLLDPQKGSNTLKIVSQVFGIFKIKLDLQKASVDTIIKKAAQCTGVPPQYLQLYSKLEDYKVISDINTISDGNTLILRLMPPHKLLRNYGKDSYIPLQEQTMKGIAKFYSILRHLAHDDNTNHNAVVAGVMKLTECPPLATALHHILTFQTFSHLSYLVALYEGFYYLSRAILTFFCNVQLEQTFEFSDYIFGLILKLAQLIKNDDLLTFTPISLTCPKTKRRLINPVSVRNKFIFEEIAVKTLIADNEALPECNLVGITVEDLLPDKQMERFLISCAFTPIQEVVILERKYQSKLRIPPISIPCTWKELAESAACLEVTSPGCEVATRNVLTYITDGQFAVFTDINKGNEATRVLYNPVSCEEEIYTLEQMKGFVCSDKKKIRHNLVDFLNAKLKARISEDSISLSMLSTVVIHEQKDIKQITREPKEAIMILLDTSDSMDSPIFDDRIKGYKCIRAARDFFAAFANRTQAYEYHHVIGVICFNTQIKVALPLCEVISQFKSILEGTDTKLSGMTALYDAMKKASEILNEFGSKHPLCVKRILCLTDGQDNMSKTTPFQVAKLLQSQNIIVDTVLITGSTGYPVQKAICHATAGFCFLPTSVPEGMRLFEMEVLLSIAERSKVTKPTLTTEDDFKKLQSNDYDSNDPFSFRSLFFEGLDKTICCSARRMILLATFRSNEHGTISKQKSHVEKVMLEMNKYIKNPHEYIEIFPSQNNVCNWKILLRAPDGTPYEKGIYLLFAKFPENYPYKAPEIRFVTPIYHCNINSMGRICHPILGRNYIPSLSIRDIFDQIFGLLMAPEPDNPLDSVLAEEYHTNKDEYMRKARELNKQKACDISWEQYKKTLSEDTVDVSEELKCPLTGKLFEDPVLTPHGHTYERRALLDYMRRNYNLDPKARKPLCPEDLRPQTLIKKIVDDFRKTNLHVL